MNPTKWHAQRFEARNELQLRKMRGEKDSPRMRFLAIVAAGGPVGMAASAAGLYASPTDIRYCWDLILFAGEYERYKLNLWYCAKSARPLEVHDGWARDRKKRRRRWHIYFKARTLEEAMKKTAELMRTWDATNRLGGVA